MKFTKKIAWLVMITATVLLTHCQQNHKEQSGKQQKEPEITEEINKVETTLQVNGMTCTGCENTVETGVKEIAGVIEVNASHTDSSAHVIFDSTRTSQIIIEEGIINAGYEVVKAPGVK